MPRKGQSFTFNNSKPQELFVCQMRELFFQIQNTQLYSCLAENIESEDAQGPLICIFCMFFYAFHVLLYGLDICLLPVFGWAL